MSARLLRNVDGGAIRDSQENDMLQKGGPAGHNGNVVTLRISLSWLDFLVVYTHK